MFEDLRSRLRERRPRLGCIALILLGTPVFSCCAAMAAGSIVPPKEIDPGVAGTAFEAERAAAEAIGLSLASTGSVATSQDSHAVRLQVGAGDCVAAIGAAHGYVRAKAVTIRRVDDSAVLGLHADVEGLTAHAQACVWLGGEVEIIFAIEHQDTILGRPRFSEGTLRYALLVGRPAGGVAALNRGRPGVDAFRDIPDSELLLEAERQRGGRTARGPELRVSDYRARLVPETAEAYAALLAAAQNQNPTPLSPRVDPLVAATPASWRPLAAADAETTPEALRGDKPAGADVPAAEVNSRHRFQRVLAVIDAAALGECVDVHLVRMSYGTHAGARPSTIDTAQRTANLMVDRVCPADGRRLYVTDRRDRDDYVLRLY